MATTITVSASMRTRKTSSSSNYKSSAASQEFYTNDYNFVGIVNFPGLNLTNKVITQIKLKVTAAEAGYGAGTTKTVYVRESKYQAASQSGVTGGNYYGPVLGTFTGSFYGNTTTTTLSGTLFTNLAAYLAAGNNTICLYNPSPSTSSQGYSNNYMQWDACQIIVTYEEAASVPTTSPTYTPPSISAFSAERCNTDGSAPQQDGTKVRVNITAGAASVGAKNTMTCAVYYKLSSASAWTLAQNVTPVSYGVSKANLLLSPTFNALSSYDIKVAMTDFFTSSTPVEQEISISTKQVMQDFYRDGTGVAFGKVAETPNAAEFAWKLVASDPQIDTMRMKTFTSVAQLGQTVGSATINGCRSAMSDGSILMAQASDFASAELPSTIGTILIGRIHTIRSFCLFMGKEPVTGIFKQALDSAGTSFTGTWYRVYDSASVIPVSGGGTGQTSAAGIRNAIGLGNTTGALPVTNGGHGATSAKQGLINLGVFYSATLPASGTDGQVSART